jgi:hypothetical protein
MWERLQRFRALDSAARVLFLRGSVLLPLISLGLRFRGFNATQAVLRNFLSSSNGATRPPAANEAEEAARTARMVRAAAHYGFGHPTCLEKSLALWWLLARQGIASSLRIGTRKAAGEFAAHAWVEYKGAALDEFDEVHRHYAAFDAAFPAIPPDAG